ncbi:speckle-type POZ protein B-like [Paramacrobiotus metropolitanus]|uniref:speckle-type POZ protein B-like n=1 Tax=Paramacrobiotus metropolitanus TaxID=2943436 RepID=UPI002445C691|nr:speckle-type POZ protein B-like [Paramacrobiotus metropolitanus]
MSVVGEGSRSTRSVVISPGGTPAGTVRTCKEITCQRTLDLDLVRFTWNIENFSWYKDSRGQAYDVLESPHFQTDDGQYDWVLRLIIHPRPDRPADELCRDSVQIFLHLHNAPRETAHLKCQFVFVRFLHATKEDQTYQISRFREFRRGETWGFRRFIQRNTLFDPKNGFLQSSDRLTVKINLDIIRAIRDEVAKPARNPLLADGLQEGLQVLYKTMPHSDVTFVCSDGSHVKAHKAILSARSPVFAAMLSHDLSEQRTNTIDLKDIPKDVLETFLSLVYTGVSTTLDEHAGSILVLAERYQLTDLKEKSVDALRKKMCAGNAADLLPLADLHNAPELKNEVMEFMVNNHEKIRDTEAFRDFFMTHPALMAQLYERKQESSKRFKMEPPSSPGEHSRNH